jgi:hypothetical protein
VWNWIRFLKVNQITRTWLKLRSKNGWLWAPSQNQPYAYPGKFYILSLIHLESNLRDNLFHKTQLLQKKSHYSSLTIGSLMCQPSRLGLNILGFTSRARFIHLSAWSTAWTMSSLCIAGCHILNYVHLRRIIYIKQKNKCYIILKNGNN